jgi:hypothetical protein
MADIAHLILTRGHLLDWDRLLAKTGEHWPLLLSQLQMFRYVYPGYRDQVPARVLKELLGRAERDALLPSSDLEHDTTRGTLISRFSFAIDVNEWGFRDLRAEYVRRMQGHPDVRAIEASSVWDSRFSDEQQAEEAMVPGQEGEAEEGGEE